MFYTVIEAANILKVEAQTIRKWINIGTIQAKKIGKKYLIYKNQQVFDNQSDAPSLNTI